MKPEDAAKKLDVGAFIAKREQLMQRLLFIGLAASQAETPVRTGLTRRTESTRMGSGGLSGWLGANTVYAPFVHARVPFFEMGVSSSRDRMQAELDKFGIEVVASWGD